MKTKAQNKRDAIALEKRRLSAIRMFKRKVKQSGIARNLGVSRQAVSKWYKQYKAKGVNALYARRATGRPVKLKISLLAKRLPGIFKKGATAYGFTTDMWTTANLSSVIQKKYGIHYHRDHIRKILHTLGYSWQKPQKRAMERDEESIDKWIKQTWPYIKKKPENKGQ